MKELQVTERAINEGEKVDILSGLLKHAASTLDVLGVNWYVAYGSVIGQLRSRSVIPWDNDADIIVKVQDRLQLYNHIKQVISDRDGKVNGKVISDRDGHWETASAWEPVEGPDGQSMPILMIGHLADGVVRKAAWVDVPSGVTVDFCFDCHEEGLFEENIPTYKAMLGTASVNMPKPFWTMPGMVGEPETVDWTRHLIQMSTVHQGRTCTHYLCTSASGTAPQHQRLALLDATEDRTSLEVFSLEQGVAQCAAPRDFSGCTSTPVREGGSALSKDVWVKPCEASTSISPWGASTSETSPEVSSGH